VRTAPDARKSSDESCAHRAGSVGDPRLQRPAARRQGPGRSNSRSGAALTTCSTTPGRWRTEICPAELDTAVLVATERGRGTCPRQVKRSPAQTARASMFCAGASGHCQSLE
jgi:hypothetical protein